MPSEQEDDEFYLHGTPEYYVRDVDISTSPTIGEKVPGQISLEINMKSPSLDRDRGHFTCNSDLYMELFAQRASDPESNEPPSSDDFERIDFGEVEVAMKVLIEPDFEEGGEDEWFEMMESQLDAWQSTGYEAVSPNLQFQLEQDILSEILFPISELLDQEFSGIIPRMLFRRTEAENEENSESESE